VCGNRAYGRASAYTDAEPTAQAVDRREAPASRDFNRRPLLRLEEVRS
jgi:hypothetical protein